MAVAVDATKLAFNLKIIPFLKDNIPMPSPPFLALVNPESFSVKEVLRYNVKNQVFGQSGTDPSYVATCAGGFDLEFHIDGTGINGLKIPVTAQVLLFKVVTSKIVGLLHRPPYLLIQYGTFIRYCVLTSSDVTYTLFDSFGLPLRAKIKASFVERTDSLLNAITSFLSSPDLTHVRQVEEGDLLPLITHRTYNNQHYYLQVARVNRLKNFRKLKAGTELFLPPLGKKQS